MLENGRISALLSRLHSLSRAAFSFALAISCAGLSPALGQSSQPARDDAGVASKRTSYELLCDAGDAPGCYNLALMLKTGDGGEVDLPKARNLYRRSCEGGLAVACLNLSVMFLRGEGGRVDHPEARSLSQRACNGGNVKGCYNLGRMMTLGDGGAIDLVEAQKLYQFACESGLPEACASLAVLADNRQSEPTSSANEQTIARTVAPKSANGPETEIATSLGTRKSTSGLAINDASGPRVARIIGNAAYSGAMGSLGNPVNDAELIGSTLRRLGFEVEVLVNANQLDMKRAIQRLGERLHEAGENSTGLFFYAGHGVQSKGVNYLIPVGTAIEAESDLELEAVSANAILSQMEEAYVSTRIVILDACRNMPLRRRTRDGTRGLARMETPNGSFVAYSTAPGTTANDGGGRHSPFAEALATQMLIPDRPIEITFREVRRQVVERTDGDQVPWDASSLLDTFSFATTE